MLGVLSALGGNPNGNRRQTTDSISLVGILSRIQMPAKVCLVKAMVFPVVMYGYESWP